MSHSAATATEPAETKTEAKAAGTQVREFLCFARHWSFQGRVWSPLHYHSVEKKQLSAAGKCANYRCNEHISKSDSAYCCVLGAGLCEEMLCAKCMALCSFASESTRVCTSAAQML